MNMFAIERLKKVYPNADYGRLTTIVDKTGGPAEHEGQLEHGDRQATGNAIGRDPERQEHDTGFVG